MTYISSDLRRRVWQRAQGCCEYCRIHEEDSGAAYHVEHVIAVSHGGETVVDNLAYSCSRCNLYKGVNIAAADPDTKAPTFLFHPRLHQWDEHFRIDAGAIEPLTAEGRVTVFVLRLNDTERIAQREVLARLGRYPCEP